MERCRTLLPARTSPGVSWKPQRLCHKVPGDLCGGMGGEGEGLFPASVTISLVDTSFQRDGGCVAVSAVPGAHRHTLQSWVAQINDRGPAVFV